MVSAIELGKNLSKRMVQITLFKKFSSQTFITSIKVLVRLDFIALPFVISLFSYSYKFSDKFCF